MAFGKKPKRTDGLDVLEELKEPFSFFCFYEEHILGKIKKIRTFLDEKGILFFFLSPFMQRSRLILQLLVILIGVFAGVIPRSMHLLDQTKERNAASEMASLIESNSAFTFGSVSVHPLASSQYERQHVLAFLLTPAGNGTIPSKASRYDVILSSLRGVSDETSVSYSYDVIPISENGRLLLVYTNHSKQDDFTGIFGLSISVSAENTEIETAPMEIVLSDTQKTTDLFDKDGIHLASLTDQVMANRSTPIKDAEAGLEHALFEYELETERIGELPLGFTAAPAVSELKEFAEDNFIYPNLTDTSTTEDLETMEEVSKEEGYVSQRYPTAIELNGVLYDETKLLELNSPEYGELNEAEEAIFKEQASLQAKADSVLSALSTLNSARITKYESLENYKLVLNQKVSIKSFQGTTKHVGDDIESSK